MILRVKGYVISVTVRNKVEEEMRKMLHEENLSTNRGCMKKNGKIGKWKFRKMLTEKLNVLGSKLGFQMMEERKKHNIVE